MSKVTINESKLREMIAESVREVLKENGRDNRMGSDLQKMYNAYVNNAASKNQQALPYNDWLNKWVNPDGSLNFGGGNDVKAIAGKQTRVANRYNRRLDAYNRRMDVKKARGNSNFTSQLNQRNQEAITNQQDQLNALIKEKEQLTQQIQTLSGQNATLTQQNTQLTTANNKYLRNIQSLKQQLAAAQTTTSTTST